MLRQKVLTRNGESSADRPGRIFFRTWEDHRQQGLSVEGSELPSWREIQQGLVSGAGLSGKWRLWRVNEENLALFRELLEGRAGHMSPSPRAGWHRTES